MTTVEVNGVTFTDNPCTVHSVTWNGRTFKAGNRTLAALFDFQSWLDVHHPDLYVYVIQGCYNTGVSKSAGTHDKDGTLDVAVINRRNGRRVWVRARRWLRQHGWAAWWRNSGSWLAPSTWHIHMNLLGTAEEGCPVGSLIPAQNADYLAGRSGLVGHAKDPSWRPRNIAATVFDYDAWMEEEMASPKNWDAADWAAFDKHVTADVEEQIQKVRSNGYTMVQTLHLIFEKLGLKKKGER